MHSKDPSKTNVGICECQGRSGRKNGALVEGLVCVVRRELARLMRRIREWLEHAVL
jgi:hypothetical protein